MIHVVIVHCHFEPGGVTQVVQNHIAALAGGRETGRLILAGGARQSGLRESTRHLADVWTLPSLDYDDLHVSAGDGPAATRGRTLAGELTARMRQSGLTSDTTVLHWHNHSLGKNVAMPFAIMSLADSGWSVRLHIHDFAEDQRPTNYARWIEQTVAPEPFALDAILYPDHPRLTYATLTRGDADCLTGIGVDADRVVVLPNDVRLPAGHQPEHGDAIAKIRTAFDLPPRSRWVLYPVRGIRRKNVGEFMLLCQLMAEDDSHGPFIGGLTLRPDTPLERRSYDRWRTVADRFVSNIVFDAAHHADVAFIDNLSACDMVVSTSVAEGFGMAFLEPWLADRRVVARDLHHVTADFLREGVSLPSLYDQVAIPGSRGWVAAAEEAFDAARRLAWSAIPPEFRPTQRDAVDTAPPDSIDFAKLTPTLQIEILARVARDPGYRREIHRANADLMTWLTGPADEELIRHNRRVIADRFSPETQRNRLMACYRQQLRQGDIAAAGERTSTMVQQVSRAHPFFPCRTEIDVR